MTIRSIVMRAGHRVIRVPPRRTGVATDCWARASRAAREEDRPACAAGDRGDQHARTRGGYRRGTGVVRVRGTLQTIDASADPRARRFQVQLLAMSGARKAPFTILRA